MLSTGAPRGTDRGSAALGVLVLMVVTLVALAAVASGVRGLDGSRRGTASARAGAAAELGLADAAARISAGEPVAFVGAGSAGDVDYEYRATPVGTDEWIVRIEAVVGDAGRAFESTVRRQATHPYTVFVTRSGIFGSNAGVISGKVGTNGSMAVTGASPGSSQELHRPAASCTGCANPIERDGPFPVPAVDPPTGPVRPCPTDATFTGVVDGGRGEPHLCDDPRTPVVFTGAVVVRNGPLVVHVGDGVGLSLAGVDLNAAGPAADVRITVAGAGDLDLDGSRVHGLLIAPERALVVSDTSIVGTLVVGDLEIPRSTRLDVRPDPSTVTVGPGSWSIDTLHPVPID